MVSREGITAVLDWELCHLGDPMRDLGDFGMNEHLLPAAAFVQAFVPLVVFFSLQRYFVRGILAGSVKG